MILRLLIIAALFAGLFVWDRSLGRDAASERVARTEDIGRILDEADFAELDIAAMRLDFGDGRRATYARIRGAWRCLEAFQAPADEQALMSLMDMLVNAEGRVQSDDTAQAASYGLGTAETIRFSICGREVLSDPAGDVQWSVEVGRSLPGGDGAFVRPGSSAETWVIDRDPRAALEAASRENLPPLLDPTLLTRAWLGSARGIDRIFVDRADGESFELRTRPREVTEEELRQGVPSYEWVLEPDHEGGEAIVPPAGRVLAFVYYLQSAGYEAILDPRRAQELGLTGAHDQLTLFPPQRVPDVNPGEAPAQPLVLHVLPPFEGGGAAVVNPFVDTLYEVAPTLTELLVPTRAMLLGGETNPWEVEIQKAQEGR